MAHLETNPLALNTSSGAPIKSITISTNVDWFDAPVSALTGESVVFPVNVKATVAPNLVFATGASVGAPSMRLLTAAHIPNIAISQVTGLQAAINSLVKTLASANNTALAVTNNGSGDYTLTPNFGTLVNTFAQGNDNRFPASVSGLRKGAGVGSLDVAAVTMVDYWGTQDFLPGGSHRHGLVPDPGAAGGTTKFLREDATWAAPAGTGTVTNIATTSPITGGPITTTGTLGLNVGVDHAFTAAQTVKLTDAGTNSQAQVFQFGHNSSVTPVALFGTNVLFTAKSDTTNDRTLADLTAFWDVATDASRKSRFRIRTANSGSFVESLHLWGSGGASFNNTTDPGAGIVSATNFKGSGLLSTLIKADGTGLHVAAVAKTDYWDTTDFVGIGPSNAHGLVPAPGNPGGSPLRYLREDASWQTFTPAAGAITNTMLATMAANTLKANATGGVASPTDVTALVARSALLLNLESQTARGVDADYTILPTDRYVYPSTTITTRTWSLPLANSVNAGSVLTIADPRNLFGATVTVQRQGSDLLLPGSLPSFALDQRGGSITLVSDGISKWYITNVTPSVRRRIFTANTTYNVPVGVKAIFIECIGGGGGGAGAVAAASNGSAGAGGGGGGYANYLATNVAGGGYGVTIGAAGAGGVAGNNNGSTGGNTVLGGFCQAAGGVGGTAGTSGNTVIWTTPGDGGLPTTGDVLLRGSAGYQGYRASGTQGLSGYGGGCGDGGGTTAGRFTEGAGANAAGYGNGGAGALSLSTSSFAGGNGTQGVIIITEYY